MNPLITDINAHVQSETLAPRTVIAWDPTTNTGSITYECANFFVLKEDGSYFGQPAPSGAVSVSLETVIAETVDVEVAPGVFQPVPMALVAGAIKAHFKKHIGIIRAPQEP
jgi:hypothetical protein